MMLRATAGVLGVLFLVGCIPTWMDPGYMSRAGRTQRVREAADSFGHDFRWGRFEKAAERVHPDRREAFRALATELDGRVRFTGFEIESVELGLVRGEATVSASFTLYRLPSIEETTLRERQQWRFDTVRRRWLLEPNLALYRGDAAASSEP
jgi:hypothetical protein